MICVDFFAVSCNKTSGVSMIRIVHYLNQFFGQVGGEDKADIPPFRKDGPVGPGVAFAARCGTFGEIVGSIVCGDNYIAQNQEQALAEILHLIQSYRPDALLAGPAFNAGRYGPACGAVCKIDAGTPGSTGPCRAPLTAAAFRSSGTTTIKCSGRNSPGTVIDTAKLGTAARSANPPSPTICRFDPSANSTTAIK